MMSPLHHECLFLAFLRGLSELREIFHQSVMKHPTEITSKRNNINHTMSFLS